MVLPDSTTRGPGPPPPTSPPPFTRETQKDLTAFLAFRGLPQSTFLTRLTVGHMNLYAHAQRREFTDQELLAFRDAAQAGSAAYWATKTPLDLAAFALAVVPYRRLPRFLRYLPKTMLERPLVGFMPGSLQHRIIVGTFRLSLFFCATGLNTIPAMWRFQSVAVRREDSDPRLAGCVTMKNLNMSRAELEEFGRLAREGRVAYTFGNPGGAGVPAALGKGDGGDAEEKAVPEWAAKAWEERDQAPAYDDASPTAAPDDGWKADGQQRADGRPDWSEARERTLQQQQQQQQQRGAAPARTPSDEGASPVDELLTPLPPTEQQGQGAPAPQRPVGVSWDRVRANAAAGAVAQDRARRGGGGGEDAWAARRRAAAAGKQQQQKDGFGGGVVGEGQPRGSAGDEQRDFEARMERERRGRDSNAEERRKW
jgi:hypothetical protein